MTTVLIILAVVLAAPLVYLATLDGNYTVRRSLDINAARHAVFARLRDLRGWPEWSPWLMHEPDATLDYSETPDREGGWYSWDGRTIGAGRLTHTAFSGEAGIEQRLEFRRPFKSVCRVWWELEPQGDSTTRVHWNMAGRMPFLFRFMVKKMPDYIGRDFDTGLYRLRGVLEPGAEVPRLTFDGPVDLPEQTALTIPFAGNLDAMKQAMREGFPRLGRYVDAHKLTVTGFPCAVYRKVDPRKRYFECDMAMPVPTATTSAEFAVKSCPGGRYYRTTLRGSFEFLELAWFQAYSHLQMQKIKPRHGRPLLEIYETDPATVSHTNELVTALCIPVK